MKLDSWMKLELIDKDTLKIKADLTSVSFLFWLLKRQIKILKPALWPYAIYAVFVMWVQFRRKNK